MAHPRKREIDIRRARKDGAAPFHRAQNALVAYAAVANLANNHLVTRGLEFHGLALNDLALAVHVFSSNSKGSVLRASLIPRF